MYLYKYLSNNRIDVIQNLQIRFTQPHYLNDPFEAFPIVNGSGISQEKMKEVFLREASEKGINPEPFLDRDGFPRMEKFPETVHIILSMVSQMTGILSLSENYDNLLLWSHYANNHQGYVIVFDSSHSFFSQKMGSKNHLLKVRYTQERPKGTLMEIMEGDFMNTKPLEWAYEEEWRLTKNTSQANKVIYDDNSFQAICLYDIPPEAIKGIYLGANMSPSDEETLLEFCKDKGEGFFVHKMVINPDNYGLKILELADWKYYIAVLSKNPLTYTMHNVHNYITKRLLENYNLK